MCIIFRQFHKFSPTFLILSADIKRVCSNERTRHPVICRSNVNEKAKIQKYRICQERDDMSEIRRRYLKRIMKRLKKVRKKKNRRRRITSVKARTVSHLSLSD